MTDEGRNEMYTDNPIADFLAHDAEQQRGFEDLPTCEICGEPITDEWAYNVNNEWYHEDCFDSEFWKEVVSE